MRAEKEQSKKPQVVERKGRLSGALLSQQGLD